MYTCPKCNNPVVFGAGYCNVCGTPLIWDHAQPPINQQQENPKVIRCLNCHEKSLWFNSSIQMYECLNLQCKRKFTIKEVKNNRATKSFKRPQNFHKSYRKTSKVRIDMKSTGNMLKKFLLLAFIVLITLLIIVAVCMFVSNTLQIPALIAILILGLFFLVIGLNSFTRYRLTFTRFFLVSLFSFIFVFLASAYLDIRTIDDVKNNISGAFSIKQGQFRENIDLIVKRTDLKTVQMNDIDNQVTSTQTNPTSPNTSQTISSIIKEKSNEKKVIIRGGILIGADGHHITLKNNPNAVNTSFTELKSFLQKDTTDQIPYDYGKFVCADFAERLHNNAELAGIKAGFVSINLGPCSYYPTGGGHALNMFQTTDKGLVYIDCTGFQPGINADKIVDLTVGKDYIPRSIFPQPGWSSNWDNMGKVENIDATEW